MMGATLRYAAGAWLALSAPLALALWVGMQGGVRAWERARAAALEAAVAEARAALATVDAADARAVTALCREDLWVDTWMRAIAGGETAGHPSLARQVAPRARALGFGALALVDLGGRRPTLLGALPSRGLDAPALATALARAPDRAFVWIAARRTADGPAVPFRLHGCVTAREGVRVGIVGGRAMIPEAPPWSEWGARGPVRFYLTGRDGALPADAPEIAARERVIAFTDASGATVGQWVATLPAARAPLPLPAPRDLGLLLLGWLATALAIGAVVARRLAGPLAALETAARRVAGGDLGTAVGDTHGGAARRTTTAFNEMTEELTRARARLRRAERVAAWRDIARRIAHEIKNPLSPIQVSIETMRKTYAKRHPDFDEIFEESTLTILEEVERLKRIVTEFSQFARMPRPRPEALQLGELAESVASLHRGGPVEVRVEAPPGEALAAVRADREQITQVLVNLVNNAIEASRARHGDTGGRVEIRLAGAEGGVTLEVMDDGPGVPLEQRLRIFEPYFTTKSEGTGLGLAIAYRIVEDHGGTLEVADAPSGGATLRMFLPVEGPPPEPETLTEAPAAPATLP